MTLRTAAALAVATTLFVLFTATSTPARPTATPTPTATPAVLSEEERAQALATAREFVTLMYKRDLAGAFACVHGIDDPRAEAATVLERIHEGIAAAAYQSLSLCESNLETIGGALAAWSRVNGANEPHSLEDLVDAAFLTEVPRCPSQGHYVYHTAAKRVSVACTRDAHREIGVMGDYPALSTEAGLTIGEQPLRFERDMPIRIEQWNVDVAAWQPDFRTLWLALTETSSADRGPLRKRAGLLVMSRRDGIWKVDLWLTSQVLNTVFDAAEWLQQTPIAIQALCYVVAGQPGTRSPESEMDRAHLLLRICEGNLRTLAVSLEDESLKRHGSYPPTGPLERVLHRPASALPTCPAGGRYAYRRTQAGGAYTIFCAGQAHADAGVPTNLPSVDPVLGVVDTAPAARPSPTPTP